MGGVRVWTGGIELDQCRAGVDLLVRTGEKASHTAGERRGDRSLHLHALDDGDRNAGGHLVADTDGHGDDDARSR